MTIIPMKRFNVPDPNAGIKRSIPTMLKKFNLSEFKLVIE